MPKFIEVDLLGRKEYQTEYKPEYRMINVDEITLIVPGITSGSTTIHVGQVDDAPYTIFESYDAFVRRLEDLLIHPGFIDGAPSRLRGNG